MVIKRGLPGSILAATKTSPPLPPLFIGGLGNDYKRQIHFTTQFSWIVLFSKLYLLLFS